MSQQEILEVLEKEGRPMSLREICRFLNEIDIPQYTGDGNRRISHSLQKMIKHGEIKFFEIDRNKAKKIFKEKAPYRRMKLYYIAEI